MNTDKEKLLLLARDLTKEYPRSPREKLGGYVLAARCIDKCRAVLAGKAGEYHYACPLDQIFFSFSGINPDELKSFVASGVDDKEIEKWIRQHASQKSAEEVIQWNNQQREQKLSDLSIKTQVFMESYMEQYVPQGKVVYRFFDVFDYEEKRL